MDIAGCTFQQNFWLADVSEDCLLGLDFLEQPDCSINVKYMVVKIEGKTIPLLHFGDESSSVTCYRVVAIEDIPAMLQTEAIIPVNVLDYSGGLTWGLLNPMVLK